MAFMPRLSEYLLGEPLKMPGIATWWCGEPDSLSYVLKNLDRLTLKLAYRDRSQERRIFRQLRTLPREALVQRIKDSPNQFVAQERIFKLYHAGIYEKQSGISGRDKR